MADDDAPVPAGVDALIPVGVVARPHGVRGELRVHRLNPESNVLYEAGRVFLRTGEGTRAADVERSRPGPRGAALMTLSDVVGREAAEALRGAEVCVPRSLLPMTDDDEWYFVDLIGLAALTEDGERLGDVVDVIEYPTITCLAVRDGDEVWEVPMTEAYLLEVLVGDGRVILSRIDDLPARTPNKYEQGKKGK